jgi:hypothetical protein
MFPAQITHTADLSSLILATCSLLRVSCRVSLSHSGLIRATRCLTYNRSIAFLYVRIPVFYIYN